MPDESEETLEQSRSVIEAENASVQVLRGEIVDTSFRTIARAQSRLKAYNTVYDNYEKFIVDQSEKLSKGLFAASTYKELGVARLISLWVIESEQFLDAVAPLLGESEKNMRKGFMEQSFEKLPEPFKTQLLDEFNKKKQELLVWLVQEIQKVQEKAKAVA
jgi:hypothetical protein